MRSFIPPALVAAALGVSGCSTTLTDTQVKTIHYVAVVSMLGETFHGIEIANSGLRGAHYDANVVDWRLDDDITKYVIHQLAARGLAARGLDISPKRTEDFYSKPLVSNDHIFIQGYASPEPHYSELCKLALAQGDDMLVVVARTSNPREILPMLGYGVIDDHFTGHAHRNVYAKFVVRVFDTRSGSQRAAAITTTADPGSENAVPWKDSYEAFTADERSALKTAIEAHIRSEVDQGLRAMNLVSQSGPN
jgi:hypothetical protein